jgi:hypothetical protein
MDYSEEDKKRWIEAELGRVLGRQVPPAESSIPGVPFTWPISPEEARIPEEPSSLAGGILSSLLKGISLGYLGKEPETMSPERATAFWAAEQAGGLLPMLLTGGMVGAGLRGIPAISKLGPVARGALQWGITTPAVTGISKEGIETAKRSPEEFLKMLGLSAAIGGGLGGLGGLAQAVKPEVSPAPEGVRLTAPFRPEAPEAIRQFSFEERPTEPAPAYPPLASEFAREQVAPATGQPNWAFLPPALRPTEPAIGEPLPPSDLSLPREPVGALPPPRWTVSPTGEITTPGTEVIPQAGGLTEEQIAAARARLTETGRVPGPEESGIVQPSTPEGAEPLPTPEATTTKWSISVPLEMIFQKGGLNPLLREAMRQKYGSIEEARQAVLDLVEKGVVKRNQVVIRKVPAETPPAQETLTPEQSAAEQSYLAQEKTTANAILHQDNPLALGGITPQSWKTPWEGLIDRMRANAAYKIENIISKSPFLTNLARGIFNHFGWPEGYEQLKNLNFGEFQSKMFDIMATAKKLRQDYTP